MSLIGFVPVKQFVSKEADVAVNVLFVSDAVVVATSVGIVAFVCDTAVVGGGAVNMLFDSGTFFVGVAENVVFAWDINVVGVCVAKSVVLDSDSVVCGDGVAVSVVFNSDNVVVAVFCAVVVAENN